MLRDLLEDWSGRLILFLICLWVALIPLYIWAVIAEAQEWEVFAAKHDCKVVGRMNGSVGTGVGVGVGGNGQVGTVVTTVTTPAKTGYACNDGITYWR